MLKDSHLRVVGLGLVVCCIFGLSSQVSAQQLGPESLCIVLRLGMPGVRGVRGYAMGNTMIASTKQPQNPALFHPEVPAVVLRRGWTNYDDADDTSIESTWFAAEIPVSSSESVGVGWMEIDSGVEQTALVPVPGSTKHLTGSHLGLTYSRIIDDRWSAGLSVTPSLDSEIVLAAPNGAELLKASGEVDLKGGRLGVAYRCDDDLVIATNYDYCNVDGTMTDNVTPATVTARLELRDFIIGAEWLADEHTRLAAELDSGHVTAGNYEKSIDAISFGVEHVVDEGLALRGGFADGTPTLGLGYENENGFQFGFAWIREQYGDELGPTLGASDSYYVSGSFPLD
jgi:hypothetical protein